MAVQGGEDIYATLLLSDSYLPGALVLAHSLRDGRTTKKLAVLVTVDTVSAEVITQLQTVYDYVISVPRIRNETPANLYLMNRADLHSAFTKINLWKQTQFRKIVYIDADVVAYRAPDELFDLPHAFAAAPDIGWPDLFNTGVMLLTPNMGDYYALKAMADRGISFDGADQGLLNMHFQNTYHRLPFTYNVTPSAHYQYIPAYRHFQSSINMVHFIGTDKPWFQGRSASAGSSPFNEMLGRWWAVYDRHYRAATPTAESPAQSQRPPEIVQYFVKGEYQPQIAYVVPTGELRPDNTPALHGQQYQYPPHLQSHQEPHHHLHQPGHQSQAAYHEAPPPHEHHHHEHHHHHHHPSPQSHEAEQSQSPSLFSHSEPSHSFSTSSVPSSTIQGNETEAREDQVQGHPQGAPPQPPPPAHPPMPEHKHEPPPPRPPLEPTWDAQRQAPPAHSRPEALNFPQMQYEMSSSTSAFVPPERYPSPPRDMWYEVPKAPPAPPKQKPPPIFPWERHQQRASRVFVGEQFEPEPSSTEPSTSESHETSSAERQSEPSTPVTPTIRITPSDPWSSFTRTNAWDEVPQIERYVEGLQKHRRGPNSLGNRGSMRLGGIGMSKEGQAELESGFARRGSKITDFPSKDERPSLPVTPAPIRRPKFWGGGAPGLGDDGEDGDDRLLPAAEGVPRQTDWDPVAQLQKLAKQQSEILLQKLGSGEPQESEAGQQDQGELLGGPVPTNLTSASVGRQGKEIPSRSLPFGSEGAKSPTYIAQSAPIHSPQPLKPQTSTSGVRSIVGDDEATPRTVAAASTSTAMQTATRITEPSYQGPGAMWEKGEDIPQFETPMPPSEEEKDVLET